MNSRWMRCMISILIDLRLALEPVISSITTGCDTIRRLAHNGGLEQGGRGGLVIIMHGHSLALHKPVSAAPRTRRKNKW